MTGAWGYFGWGWFLWGFLMFVAVGSLIARAPGGGKRTPPEEEKLRDRYKHGEISSEEYRERMHDLRRAA